MKRLHVHVSVEDLAVSLWETFLTNGEATVYGQSSSTWPHPEQRASKACCGAAPAANAGL